MTEPVAYIYEDNVFKTEKEAVLFKKEFDRNKHDGMLKHVILPLFTADEISDIYRQNNRVKMTQAEFEEWKDLYNGSLMFSDTIEIMDLDEGNNYENISKKIWTGDGDNNIENEAIFARLYADFDPDNPEETIEIVPNKKWFVVRKLPNTGGNMLKCSDDGLLMYNAIKEVATYFDTKEEAEEWTNPLTKAVHLPVE